MTDREPFTTRRSTRPGAHFALVFTTRRGLDAIGLVVPLIAMVLLSGHIAACSSDSPTTTDMATGGGGAGSDDRSPVSVWNDGVPDSGFLLGGSGV